MTCEKRGSTRLDIDNDGMFVCHYNSVLSLMHGIGVKPVYYQIVKDSEGQTSDINIHMDRLHVLSRDGSTHTITVMTKGGVNLDVIILYEEDILPSLTFTIDKSGIYYISDGISVTKWNCGRAEIIYTDESSKRRDFSIERGIKFDTRNRLVIIQKYKGNGFRIELCT